MMPLSNGAGGTCIAISSMRTAGAPLHHRMQNTSAGEEFLTCLYETWGPDKSLSWISGHFWDSVGLGFEDTRPAEAGTPNTPAAQVQGKSGDTQLTNPVTHNLYPLTTTAKASRGGRTKSGDTQLISAYNDEIR
jgi:hypothetical protein